MEPMIANFEKFNSNTGWTPNESSPWISHYSYHTTNRKLLFCDLQGGIYKDGFIITDPVIMSTTQEYGPTDLISTFFARHKCNKFCNKQWVMPHDKKVYFKVQKGSAMALPTRGTRAPLTGNGVNAGIDSGYASMKLKVLRLLKNKQHALNSKCSFLEFALFSFQNDDQRCTF
jgi:hypothetical protein